MPSIALEQEVIAASITTALYICALLMDTKTARSTDAEQRLCS